MRDGNGVMQRLPNTTASPNTTIQSASYNAVIDDLIQDCNTPRPITSGGTGAANSANARTNLGLSNNPEFGTSINVKALPPAQGGNNNSHFRLKDVNGNEKLLIAYESTQNKIVIQHINAPQSELWCHENGTWYIGSGPVMRVRSAATFGGSVVGTGTIQYDGGAGLYTYLFNSVFPPVGVNYVPSIVLRGPDNANVVVPVIMNGSGMNQGGFQFQARVASTGAGINVSNAYVSVVW